MSRCIHLAGRRFAVCVAGRRNGAYRREYAFAERDLCLSRQCEHSADCHMAGGQQQRHAGLHGPIQLGGDGRFAERPDAFRRRGERRLLNVVGLNLRDGPADMCIGPAERGHLSRYDHHPRHFESDPMKRLILATLILSTPVVAHAQTLLSVCTDRSGTITTGGVGQVAAVANGYRRTWTLKSPSTAAGVLTFSVTGVAAPASFDLPPGASFSWPAGTSYIGAISVYAATTGQSFTLVECQ